MLQFNETSMKLGEEAVLFSLLRSRSCLNLPETCSSAHDDGDWSLPSQDTQGQLVTGQGGEVETVLQQFVHGEQAGQADVEVEEVGAEADEISDNLKRVNFNIHCIYN